MGSQLQVSRLTSVRLEGPASFERSITRDKAQELLRVHSKTTKGNAAGREIPCHFRFGRFF